MDRLRVNLLRPLLLLVAVSGWGHHVQAAVVSDLVTTLPGLDAPLAFKQYSGYLKATGGRMLHYWFIESAGVPSKDPVVLWMNGGPGCSSLDGLLTEHGPFRPTLDGKSLFLNPHSWNRVASMLYLEAPAGVGFSYTADGNVTTSDDQTSLDNYVALKYFFKNFPEFATNEFYITGESYGGYYVPTLSARIVEDSGFNFRGFMVGNGLSNRAMNGNSLVFYTYYHGLIGTELWKALVHSCCKSGDVNQCDFVGNDQPDCQNKVNEAFQIISKFNIYNMFAKCYNGPDYNGTHTFRDIMYWVFRKNKKIMASYKLDPNPRLDATSSIPCIDVRNATAYLGRTDVRTAIHIPAHLPKWGICSDAVSEHYISQYATMEAQYKKVLATNKYRIMVYNGDADMACNFLGDEWFTDSLKLKVEKAWGAWMYTAEDGSQQVAGMTVKYQGLSFVTVKGAGHMVPQDKPLPALTMFSKFLLNQPL